MNFKEKKTRITKRISQQGQGTYQDPKSSGSLDYQVPQEWSHSKTNCSLIPLKHITSNNINEEHFGTENTWLLVFRLKLFSNHDDSAFFIYICTYQHPILSTSLNDQIHLEWCPRRNYHLRYTRKKKQSKGGKNKKTSQSRFIPAIISVCIIAPTRTQLQQCQIDQPTNHRWKGSLQICFLFSSSREGKGILYFPKEKSGQSRSIFSRELEVRGDYIPTK